MSRLSIVIPTYNRRERLGRVLRALDAQSVERGIFDVIVVDDGSTDDTSAWLNSQSFGFALDAHRQENAGPAAARNVGVLRASGELILFLDDDVVPLPELVEQHLKSHAAENVPLAVIGPLGSLPHYATPWVAWEQEKVERQYSAMSRGEFAPSFRQFWTGNASVERRYLIDAGLFDPEFLRAEDVELGVRLGELGVQFRYNPKARGMHHAERSLASWIKMHSSYGRLEVRILDRLSREGMMRVLSSNFQRLRPEIRWMIQHCVGHRVRHGAAVSALRTLLERRAIARIPRVPEATCSLLANLLYWQASSEALGPTLFAEVMARARGEHFAPTATG